MIGQLFFFAGRSERGLPPIRLPHASPFRLERRALLERARRFWYAASVHERAADAIVVLGARIRPDGLPGPAAGRRVVQAVQLFEQGLAPVVVPSGGRRWHGHMEAISMLRMLQRLGVPKSAIVVEPFALSTLENAYFSTRLARLRRWRRLTVVTCPWHMPRAMANFEACGVDVLPRPTPKAPASFRARAYMHARECTCRRLDSLRLRVRFPW